MERARKRWRGQHKGGESQRTVERAMGMRGRPGRSKGEQGMVVRPLRGGYGDVKGSEGQGKVERDRER